MSEHKRILVVDDDDATREVLCLALTDEGYEVKTAQNGKMAFKQMEKFQPDLILLDMRMPIMDGWSFAQELRNQSQAGVPVVVCTAAVNTASRAAEVNADAYIAKPFVLNELLSLLSQVLNRKAS